MFSKQSTIAQADPELWSASRQKIVARKITSN